MLIVSYILRLVQIIVIVSWNYLLPSRTPGARLRLTLAKLGPVFVKAGQLLSTRADLLPAEIITELSKLQDKLEPFAPDIAIRTIEQQLGAKITSLYKDFATTPIAAASIAQVHSATLPNGDSVVVKVLRPNIEKLAMRDMGLLQFLAKILELLVPKYKHLKPYAIISELKASLNDELDLAKEAANASQFARTFSNSALLYIPRVYWSHSGKRVLTLEKVSGYAVTDISALQAENIDLRLLAERGVELFFTQVFRDCFFHADLHPGNLWVAKQRSPQFIALDFGIVGSLTPNDQYYLAKNLAAIFANDYRQVAKLHLESGWIDPNTKLVDFEAAIRTVCEPIFAKPLQDISFATTLLRLLQTAARFKMNIQPQLILLQKTLVNVEGIARQLCPELELWLTAKPFIDKYANSRVKHYFKELPNLVLNKLQPENTAVSARTPTWPYFMSGMLTAFMLVFLYTKLWL